MRDEATCAPLFDHLAGCGEQFVWDGDPEGLGGLEVDDEVALAGDHSCPPPTGIR